MSQIVRPSIGWAALVVLAVVAVVAVAYQLGGQAPAHTKDAAPSIGHIRLD